MAKSVFSPADHDSPSERRSDLTYEIISERVHNPVARQGLFYLSGYAKRLSKQELLRLGRDFINEQNPDRIFRYIGVFTKRRCPVGFKKILGCLRIADRRQRRAVLAALSLIRHPTLHKLAETLKSEDKHEEAV